jgi:hypothetical protein
VDPSVGTSSGKVGLTPRLEIQQALEAPATMATTFPSSLGEVGSPLKKSCTKGCLPPSARYAHVGCCILPM